jgi:GGDEF domain-containing protein/predicted RNA methylase
MSTTSPDDRLSRLRRKAQERHQARNTAVSRAIAPKFTPNAPIPTVSAAVEQQVGTPRAPGPAAPPANTIGDRRESQFRQWYAEKAAAHGLDPDPDNPLHHYDYRGAWRAGADAVVDPSDGLPHWPSEFKRDTHPNLIVDGVNTRTGEPVAEDIPFTTRLGTAAAAFARGTTVGATQAAKGSIVAGTAQRQLSREGRDRERPSVTSIMPRGDLTRQRTNYLGRLAPAEMGDAETHPLFRAADRVEQLADEHLPIDDRLKNSFWNRQVPEGLGSFGLYLGIGAATRGRAGMVPSMSTAAFAGAAQAYEDAKAAGASEEDALLAGGAGTIPGAIQVVPILRALDRVNRRTGGALIPRLRQWLLSGGQGGLEELIVESLGQFGQNVIARDIFDGDRDLLEGVREAGQVGGTVGLIANLLLGIPGAVNAKGTAQDRADRRAERTDEEQPAKITEGSMESLERRQAQPAEGRQPGTTLSGLRRRLGDRIDPSRAQENAQLQEQRDQAQRQAETDALTGLGNQAAFTRALPTAEADPDIEVVILDVENLKALNDNLGDVAGDEAIRRAGEAIAEATGRGFRHGGDELAFFAPTGQGEALAQQIQEAFGEQDAGGFPVRLRYGVGQTRADADAGVRAAKANREGPAYRPKPAASDLGRGGVKLVKTEARESTGEGGEASTWFTFETPQGNVEVRADIDGDNVNIGWIGGQGQYPNAVDPLSLDLGAAATRGILRQVVEAFPNASTYSGLRIGGKWESDPKKIERRPIPGREQKAAAQQEDVQGPDLTDALIMPDAAPEAGEAGEAKHVRDLPSYGTMITDPAIRYRAKTALRAMEDLEVGPALYGSRQLLAVLRARKDQLMGREQGIESNLSWNDLAKDFESDTGVPQSIKDLLPKHLDADLLDGYYDLELALKVFEGEAEATGRLKPQPKPDAPKPTATDLGKKPASEAAAPLLDAKALQSTRASEKTNRAEDDRLARQFGPDSPEHAAAESYLDQREAEGKKWDPVDGRQGQWRFFLRGVEDFRAGLPRVLPHGRSTKEESDHWVEQFGDPEKADGWHRSQRAGWAWASQHSGTKAAPSSGTKAGTDSGTKAPSPAPAAPGPDAPLMDRALYGDLHSFTEAAARWAKRRETGLTDEELRAAIGQEFGIQGGRTIEGGGLTWHTGGKNPSFQINRGSKTEQKLSGKKLLDAARRLLGIPHTNIVNLAASKGEERLSNLGWKTDPRAIAIAQGELGVPPGLTVGDAEQLYSQLVELDQNLKDKAGRTRLGSEQRAEYDQAMAYIKQATRKLAEGPLKEYFDAPPGPERDALLTGTPQERPSARQLGGKKDPEQLRKQDAEGRSDLERVRAKLESLEHGDAIVFEDGSRVVFNVKSGRLEGDGESAVVIEEDGTFEPDTDAILWANQGRLEQFRDTAQEDFFGEKAAPQTEAPLHGAPVEPVQHPNSFYHQGDRAEYTGESKKMFGGTFYEGKLVEGHRTGESVWTKDAPAEGTPTAAAEPSRRGRVTETIEGTGYAIVRKDGSEPTNKQARIQVKKLDGQLHAAAIDKLEASRRSPTGSANAPFQLGIVRAMDPAKLTQSDRDTLKQILGYGDELIQVEIGKPLPPPAEAAAPEAPSAAAPKPWHSRVDTLMEQANPYGASHGMHMHWLSGASDAISPPPPAIGRDGKPKPPATKWPAYDEGHAWAKEHRDELLRANDADRAEGRGKKTWPAAPKTSASQLGATSQQRLEADLTAEAIFDGIARYTEFRRGQVRANLLNYFQIGYRQGLGLDPQTERSFTESDAPLAEMQRRVFDAGLRAGENAGRKQTTPAKQEEITTPGTKLSWKGVAGWIEAVSILSTRKASAKLYEQREAHVMALTPAIVEATHPIDAADLVELKTMLEWMRGRSGWFPTKGTYGYEKGHQHYVALLDAIDRTKTRIGKQADQEPGGESMSREKIARGVERLQAAVDELPDALVCVACANTKVETTARARDLYVSPLFRFGRQFAERFPSKQWRILSAKHGLVHPNQTLETYDQTLDDLSKTDLRAWANNVFQHIKDALNDDRGRSVILLAGEKYRAEIASRLEAEGYGVVAPLEGMGIGEQLGAFKRFLGETGSPVGDEGASGTVEGPHTGPVDPASTARFEHWKGEIPKAPTVGALESFDDAIVREEGITEEQYSELSELITARKAELEAGTPTAAEPTRKTQSSIGDLRQKATPEQVKALVAAYAKLLEEKGAGEGPRTPGQITAWAEEVLGVKYTDELFHLDDVMDAIEGAANLTVREMFGTQEPGQQMGDRLKGLIQLEEVLFGKRTNSGEMKELQQFSTPLPIAEAAAYAAGVFHGDRVIEPSGGTGNLVNGIFGRPGVDIQVNEIDPRRRAVLEAVGFDNVTGEDALRLPLTGKRYNVAIMNPPYGSIKKGRKYSGFGATPFAATDVSQRHVAAALNTLVDGGRLVAVLPEGVMGTSSFAFRKWLKENHTVIAYIKSPPGSYKSRGVRSGSVILVVDKGSRTSPPPTIWSEPQTWDAWIEQIGLFGPARPAFRNTHGRVEAKDVAPVGGKTATPKSEPAPPVPPVPPVPPSKSWAVEADGSKNRMRYATEAEAKAAAHDLGMRWFGAKEIKAVETTDAPTHRWDPQSGAVEIANDPPKTPEIAPKADPLSGEGASDEQLEQFLRDRIQESAEAGGTPSQEDIEALDVEIARRARKRPDYGSTNKIVTKDRAEELKARLKGKLDRLQSGVDPESMRDAIELGIYHAEAGVRQFAAWSQLMVDDVGEWIRPYLRGVYSAMRHWPGLDSTGMNSDAEVEGFLAQQAKRKAEAKDVARPGPDSGAGQTAHSGVRGAPTGVGGDRGATPPRGVGELTNADRPRSDVVAAAKSRDEGTAPPPKAATLVPRGPRRTVTAREGDSAQRRAEIAEANDSRVFTPYSVGLRSLRSPHPRLVVETRSMAGMPAPAITAELKSPLTDAAWGREGEKGGVSDEQVDVALRILTAWDNGHGFLAADDVGVGKTREAAVVILEAIARGHKRILYTTKNQNNVADAMGELRRVATGDENGAFPASFVYVRDYPSVKKGLDSLPIPDGPVVIFADATNFDPYIQAIEEARPTVWIADEAHEYKNIATSNRGMAWARLHQDMLRRDGKFAYLTATPAIGLDELNYLYGLKEWPVGGFGDWMDRKLGRSVSTEVRSVDDLANDLRPEFREWWRRNRSQFPTERGALQAFLREKAAEALAESEFENDLVGESTGLENDNAAAGGRRSFMRASRDAFAQSVTPAETEQVLRELKGSGHFVARDLWRGGVQFEVDWVDLVGTGEGHSGDPSESAAVRARYNKAAALGRAISVASKKYGRMNARVKTSGLERSMIQGYMKQVLFEIRLPRVIEMARAALAQGKQVVISVHSVTGDSESVAGVSEFDADANLNSRMLAAINAINTQEVVREGEGDSMEFVEVGEIPEALMEIERLKQELAELPPMRDPVRVFEEAFGAKNVAAITGKVKASDRRKVMAEFQAGQRTVAVISKAGKIGISLHDVNNRPRTMIVADYEWSADTFKQELGRVDRTGQRSPPEVRLVATNIAGERKFAATIAARMTSLGATSKGSAESTGTDALDVFDMSGNIARHAMVAAVEEMSDADRSYFTGSAFTQWQRMRDGADEMSVRRTPTEAADMRSFLLDLLMFPVDAANRAMELWSGHREAMMTAEAQSEFVARRTGRRTGEVVRTTQLREDPELTLVEVKNEAGERKAIVQGFVTEYIVKIQELRGKENRGGILSNRTRNYVQFTPNDDSDPVSGLEIGPGEAKRLLEYYAGHKRAEITPESALEDLAAGEKINVQGPKGVEWQLHQRQDGRIEIRGATLAQHQGAVTIPSLKGKVGFDAKSRILWMKREVESLAPFFEAFPPKAQDVAQTADGEMPAMPQSQRERLIRILSTVGGTTTPAVESAARKLSDTELVRAVLDSGRVDEATAGELRRMLKVVGNEGGFLRLPGTPAAQSKTDPEAPRVLVERMPPQAGFMRKGIMPTQWVWRYMERSKDLADQVIGRKIKALVKAGEAAHMKFARHIDEASTMVHEALSKLSKADRDQLVQLLDETETHAELGPEVSERVADSFEVLRDYFRRSWRDLGNNDRIMLSESSRGILDAALELWPAKATEGFWERNDDGRWRLSEKGRSEFENTPVNLGNIIGAAIRSGREGPWPTTARGWNNLVAALKDERKRVQRPVYMDSPDLQRIFGMIRGEGGILAYFPHVFGGDWVVRHGAHTKRFIDRNDAVDYAQQLIDDGIAVDDLLVSREGFTGDGSLYTSRKQYHALVNELSHQLAAEESEVRNALHTAGKIKTRPRRRWFAHTQKREVNLQTFEKDLRTAVMVYAFRHAKKVSFDPFRKQGLEIAESLPVDGGWRDWAESYIPDAQGVPGAIEESINRTLTGLTGGRTKPFQMQRWVSGWQRLMGIFHLGFSPSTAMVNLTQIPINVIPGLPSGGTRYVMRAQRLLANRSEKVDKILDESGILYQHAKHQGGEYVPTPWQNRGLVNTVAMYMFTKSEQRNRATAVLAMYEYQVDRGATHGRAMREAIDFSNFTNFVYGIEGSGKIQRSSIGRALMQFKTYSLNQIFFSYHIMRYGNNRQRSAFLANMIAFGGLHVLAAATPLAAANWLLGMTGLFEDEDGVKRTPYDALMDAARKLGLNPLTDFVQYGILSLFGLTFGERVGSFGQMRDFDTIPAGKLADVLKVMQETDPVRRRNAWRRLAGSQVARVLRMIEAAETGEVRDQYGNLIKTDPTVTDLAGAGLGIKTVEQAERSRKMQRERRATDQYRGRRARYLGKAAAAHRLGDRAERDRIRAEAREKGIRISLDDVRQYVKRRDLPDEERRERRTPRDLRPSLFP